MKSRITNVHQLGITARTRHHSSLRWAVTSLPLVIECKLHRKCSLMFAYSHSSYRCVRGAEATFNELTCTNVALKAAQATNFKLVIWTANKVRMECLAGDRGSARTVGRFACLCFNYFPSIWDRCKGAYKWSPSEEQFCLVNTSYHKT